MSPAPPAQRPIELILLRELASYLDMPIFVVDVEGTRRLTGNLVRGSPEGPGR